MAVLVMRHVVSISSHQRYGHVERADGVLCRDFGAPRCAITRKFGFASPRPSGAQPSADVAATQATKRRSMATSGRRQGRKRVAEREHEIGKTSEAGNRRQRSPSTRRRRRVRRRWPYSNTDRLNASQNARSSRSGTSAPPQPPTKLRPDRSRSPRKSVSRVLPPKRRPPSSHRGRGRSAARSAASEHRVAEGRQKPPSRNSVSRRSSNRRRVRRRPCSDRRGRGAGAGGRRPLSRPLGPESVPARRRRAGRSDAIASAPEPCFTTG